MSVATSVKADFAELDIQLMRIVEQKKRETNLFLFFVSPERLELSTHWLRVSCSTNWARETMKFASFLDASFPKAGAKLLLFFDMTKFFKEKM